MKFPGGCQQGCSGRNSAAPERTDRVATAFAEDTGPGEGGTWGNHGEGGTELVSWLGFWGWLVCCLTWDYGFMSGIVFCESA